ncbi:uncharacterized protein BDR25DRAFT_363441 [Lindgomyces ingoldianus]|uniref:Uncharacterized protein n=1 Tax=Lindgomyces ingoldianus TaxID=673940 RepID=A0ACB6Q9P0_9PLEO|nr:uncharacterized protein BDR25DRAFT_363441 [Lindgomyces ingoldianus]KAF2462861.1 hypothetical protein BDR25DRAFT_363441 [Lindgomyces ingoldianus]
MVQQYLASRLQPIIVAVYVDPLILSEFAVVSHTAKRWEQRPQRGRKRLSRERDIHRDMDIMLNVIKYGNFILSIVIFNRFQLSLFTITKVRSKGRAMLDKVVNAALKHTRSIHTVMKCYHSYNWRIIPFLVRENVPRCFDRLFSDTILQFNLFTKRTSRERLDGITLKSTAQEGRHTLLFKHNLFTDIVYPLRRRLIEIRDPNMNVSVSISSPYLRLMLHGIQGTTSVGKLYHHFTGARRLNRHHDSTDYNFGSRKCAVAMQERGNAGEIDRSCIFQPIDNLTFDAVTQPPRALGYLATLLAEPPPANCYMTNAVTWAKIHPPRLASPVPQLETKHYLAPPPQQTDMADSNTYRDWLFIDGELRLIQQRAPSPLLTPRSTERIEFDRRIAEFRSQQACNPIPTRPAHRFLNSLHSLFSPIHSTPEKSLDKVRRDQEFQFLTALIDSRLAFTESADALRECGKRYDYLKPLSLEHLVWLSEFPELLDRYYELEGRVNRVINHRLQLIRTGKMLEDDFDLALIEIEHLTTIEEANKKIVAEKHDDQVLALVLGTLERTLMTDINLMLEGEEMKKDVLITDNVPPNTLHRILKTPTLARRYEDLQAMEKNIFPSRHSQAKQGAGKKQREEQDQEGPPRCEVRGWGKAEVEDGISPNPSSGSFLLWGDPGTTSPITTAYHRPPFTANELKKQEIDFLLAFQSHPTGCLAVLEMQLWSLAVSGSDPTPPTSTAHLREYSRQISRAAIADTLSILAGNERNL